MAGCDGKTCDDVFRQDDELILRIIKESCYVLDRGVAASNSAGIKERKTALTPKRKTALTSG